MSRFRIEGVRRRPNKPPCEVSTVIIAINIEEAVEKAEQCGIQVARAMSITHPDCYKPNNDPYPLCVGIDHNKCKSCDLYEDKIESSPYE